MNKSILSIVAISCALSNNSIWASNINSEELAIPSASRAPVPQVQPQDLTFKILQNFKTHLNFYVERNKKKLALPNPNTKVKQLLADLANGNLAGLSNLIQNRKSNSLHYTISEEEIPFVRFIEQTLEASRETSVHDLIQRLRDNADTETKRLIYPLLTFYHVIYPQNRVNSQLFFDLVDNSIDIISKSNQVCLTSKVLGSLPVAAFRNTTNKTTMLIEGGKKGILFDFWNSMFKFTCNTDHSNQICNPILHDLFVNDVITFLQQTETTADVDYKSHFEVLGYHTSTYWRKYLHSLNYDNIPPETIKQGNMLEKEVKRLANNNPFALMIAFDLFLTHKSIFRNERNTILNMIPEKVNEINKAAASYLGIPEDKEFRLNLLSSEHYYKLMKLSSSPYKEIALGTIYGAMSTSPDFRNLISQHGIFPVNSTRQDILNCNYSRSNLHKSEVNWVEEMNEVTSKSREGIQPDFNMITNYKQFFLKIKSNVTKDQEISYQKASCAFTMTENTLTSMTMNPDVINQENVNFLLEVAIYSGYSYPQAKVFTSLDVDSLVSADAKLLDAIKKTARSYNEASAAYVDLMDALLDGNKADIKQALKDAKTALKLSKTPYNILENSLSNLIASIKQNQEVVTQKEANPIPAETQIQQKNFQLKTVLDESSSSEEKQLESPSNWRDILRQKTLEHKTRVKKNPEIQQDSKPRESPYKNYQIEMTAAAKNQGMLKEFQHLESRRDRRFEDIMADNHQGSRKKLEASANDAFDVKKDIQLYSRRINDQHRIVYSIDTDQKKIIIYSQMGHYKGKLK